MKRYIFIAAALVLATVSCSKVYDATPVTQDQAIGFATWAEMLTKARTAGSSSFGNEDSFKVEGIKNPGASQVVVFNNIPVTTTDGTTWAYENTRYWDLSATNYYFYAVSSPDISLSLGTDGTIASTPVVYSGENNDILIADMVEVLPPYGAPVDLDFKHISSLVDLKVKKHTNLNNATVAITSVAIEGVDDEANVSVTGYSTNVPTVAWSSLANSDASTYGPNSGAVDVTLPSNVATDGSDYLINTLVVIPQTLTDSKTLKISYTITDQGGTSTFSNIVVKLNLFDTTENTTNGSPDTPITAWAAATHYVYTLIIDAKAISFSADITGWATPATNGYYYLVQ